MIPWALALALANAGNSMPARMAMMAITTSSSMRVKPAGRGPQPSLGIAGVLMERMGGAAGTDPRGAGVRLRGLVDLPGGAFPEPEDILVVRLVRRIPGAAQVHLLDRRHRP